MTIPRTRYSAAWCVMSAATALAFFARLAKKKCALRSCSRNSHAPTHMAIYHFSAKPVKRSSGRSSVACAAYRSGEKLFDERNDVLHDYSRKQGVLHTSLHFPNKPSELTREAVWNLAETAERRKDSCVAREYVVALPTEISPQERINLASAYASFLSRTKQCVVDCAVHAPSRHGDSRNFHAHFLCSTRVFDGHSFGAKVISERAGQNRKKDLNLLRDAWARVANKSLELANKSIRIDHRSYAVQKLSVVPTIHLGASATAFERRTHSPSLKRLQWVNSFSSKQQSLAMTTLHANECTSSSKTQMSKGSYEYER